MSNDQQVRANDMQIGGSHYGKSDYQHWDFVVDHMLNRYMEGAITKYICRYRDKDGSQGLLKASHFCAKLAEQAKDERVLPPPDHLPWTFGEFNAALQIIAKVYNLTDAEVRIIHDLRTWRIPEDLRRIGVQLASLAAAVLFEETFSKDGEPDNSYVSQD